MSLLFLLILLATTFALPWRHQSVGRVISAVPTTVSNPPDALVATDLHLVARLDATTGSIIWRYLPSLEQRLQSVVSVLVNETAVVMAHFVPSLVVALSEEDGHIMWTRQGCGMRIGETGFWIGDCGEEVDGMGEWIEGEEARVWQMKIEEGTLTWRLWGKGELHSLADGRLVTEAWEREEALAYGKNVIIRGDSVLLMTELGVLFSLESREGKLRWRTFVGRGCVLVGEGDQLAVVVCDGEVLRVDTQYGVIGTREKVGESIVQASVEEGTRDSVCVWLVNAEGKETAVGEGCDSGSERGWLFYERGGNTVRALSEGQEKWKINMPEGTEVLQVTTGSRVHAESVLIRPAAARVTTNRRVIYPDVDGEYVLVMAKDEEAEEGTLYAMLVDAKAGTLVDVVKHTHARGRVSTVKGEGWFIYSFWSELMMATEVHVVDLDERAESVSRVQDAVYDMAVRMLGVNIVGRLNLPHSDKDWRCEADTRDQGNSTQCKAGNRTTREEVQKPPLIRRSSKLTNHRITEMDIMQTELGLTEPWIALVLESGQVTMVPKLLLDARSPRSENQSVLANFLRMYVLSLESSSGKSKYVADGDSIARIRGTVFAPFRQRESTSKIMAFGIDLLYDEVQPAGSFDTLPSDFSYPSVVGMIVMLGAGFFYTQRHKTKAALLRSW